MKKIFKYMPVLFIMLLFTSCLKSGLDDLPAFEEASIESFKFEYRWVIKNVDNDQLKLYQMEVATTIDEEANTVMCEITVPNPTDVGAEPTNDFPTAIRDQVTLTELVGYCSISTAATIAPIGGAPELGVVADFSATPIQYEVTAADGTSKIWTVTISDFIK
ncbi:DUF5018-related domain-containing protein [Labilibaculum antarcticum]|uniref:DUF5018 domain-containing protein n=1 Tax=Labilibaculum antarcticum TaxID=1717717 RepID=A0A1Y1CGC3_9BACT|nr:hypothetical protein [Labilibaculum antarcticum]BAX79072.1 hypothetical protein ALGA_0683 [Labilibaculum antarcticum]